MATPNLVILYVADSKASTAFYQRLLGIAPTVASPNFSSFALPGGFALGLWAAAAAKPPAEGSGARGEIAFMVAGAAAVEAEFAAWKEAGIPIAQDLVTLDFGPTFVALDPDGHRLRVCLFDE